MSGLVLYFVQCTWHCLKTKLSLGPLLHTAGMWKEFLDTEVVQEQNVRGQFGGPHAEGEHFSVNRKPILVLSSECQVQRVIY